MKYHIRKGLWFFLLFSSIILIILLTGLILISWQGLRFEQKLYNSEVKIILRGGADFLTGIRISLNSQDEPQMMTELNTDIVDNELLVIMDIDALKGVGPVKVFNNTISNELALETLKGEQRGIIPDERAILHEPSELRAYIFSLMLNKAMMDKDFIKREYRKGNIKIYPEPLFQYWL